MKFLDQLICYSSRQNQNDHYRTHVTKNKAEKRYIMVENEKIKETNSFQILIRARLRFEIRVQTRTRASQDLNNRV